MFSPVELVSEAFLWQAMTTHKRASFMCVDVDAFDNIQIVPALPQPKLKK